MPSQDGITAVPCPYFLPKEPLIETGWAIPPRAPLGVLCSGECHAGGKPQPADHDLCNFGYARDVCDRFPADGAIDAIRFEITSRTGDTVYLRYICEATHAPHSQGQLRFGITEKQLSGAEGVLAVQARAFLAHALRDAAL